MQRAHTLTAALYRLSPDTRPTRIPARVVVTRVARNHASRSPYSSRSAVARQPLSLWLTRMPLGSRAESPWGRARLRSLTSVALMAAGAERKYFWLGLART